jgi:hypothetical protein
MYDSDTLGFSFELTHELDARFGLKPKTIASLVSRLAAGAFVNRLAAGPGTLRATPRWPPPSILPAHLFQPVREQLKLPRCVLRQRLFCDAPPARRPDPICMHPSPSTPMPPTPAPPLRATPARRPRHDPRRDPRDGRPRRQGAHWRRQRLLSAARGAQAHALCVARPGERRGDPGNVARGCVPRLRGCGVSQGGALGGMSLAAVWVLIASWRGACCRSTFPSFGGCVRMLALRRAWL